MSRSTHKAMPKTVHKMNEMGEIVDPKGHPARETAHHLQLGIKVTVEQVGRKCRAATISDHQSLLFCFFGIAVEYCGLSCLLFII